MSELSRILRQLGWVITVTPLPEVVTEWPDSTLGDEWRVWKGPLEVRADNASEVTRLVYEVEARVAVGSVDGTCPPWPLPAPRKRKRHRKITKELVRCGFRDPKHGTYCGALVWIKPGEKHRHAVSHGVTDPAAVETLYRDPRKKVGI